MHRPNATSILLTILLVLVAASSASADVIHLKSGQKIEGKILTDSGSTISVQTKFGSMTIERSKIESIEYQRLPKEEVKARLVAAGTDAAKLYEVALYAEAQKLKKEHKEILEQVVAHDPNHLGAREALGHVSFDGQWFATPEEVEAYKADLTDQMKERGRVLYKGKWIKEDTAKRLQGFELYNGQWLRWKEIYTLQAQENMLPILGVDLEIRESEHYALRSLLDEPEQIEVLESLEAAFAHFSQFFQPDEIEENIMDFYPIPVYVLPEPDMVTKFAEPGGYMHKLYNPPTNINDRYVDAFSFPIFFPRPLIVASMGRHLKGGGSRMTSLLGFIHHYNGNLMIRRFKRGGAMPGWVESGISHYYEGKMNGFRTLSITEYTGYEHIEKWDIKLQDFAAWYKQCVDPAFRADLPRIGDFKEKIAEEITAREIVKAYFLTFYLMETRPKEFVAYCRAVYQEKFAMRVRTSEPEAFELAFQETADHLEAEFEEWAKANLRPHPPIED